MMCLHVGVNLAEEKAASSSASSPRVSFAKVHIELADETFTFVMFVLRVLALVCQDEGTNCHTLKICNSATVSICLQCFDTVGRRQEEHPDCKN